jgi:hypothetical protein
MELKVNKAPTEIESRLGAEIALLQEKAQGLFEAREVIKGQIEAKRKELRQEWNRKEAENVAHLRQVLSERYGVSEASEKFQKVFEIAWSRGHSSGFNEVSNCFDEMADLLR